MLSYAASKRDGQEEFPNPIAASQSHLPDAIVVLTVFGLLAAVVARLNKSLALKIGFVEAAKNSKGKKEACPQDTRPNAR